MTRIFCLVTQSVLAVLTFGMTAPARSYNSERGHRVTRRFRPSAGR